MTSSDSFSDMIKLHESSRSKYADVFTKRVVLGGAERWSKQTLSILTQMALMSDSWPVKVCRHMLSLMSHSLTEASQAPDTNVRRSGDRDRLMTSPVWPEKTVVC